MTIFNKEAREKFLNASPENVLKGKNAVSKIADRNQNMLLKKQKEIVLGDIEIRNSEDTMMSIAIREKGLPVYDRDVYPLLYQYLNDYLSVEEELRVNKVAVFDTETTDRFNAYMVSVAVVIVNLNDKCIEDEYYIELNPKDLITDEAYRIHKISNSDVVGNKEFKEIEEEFAEKFKDVDLICGHNVAFDLRVVEREYNRLDKKNPIVNIPVIDTMHLTKEVVQAVDKNGRIKAPTLEESMNYFNIEEPEGDYHNALVDTRASAEVLIRTMSLSIEAIRNRLDI